MGLLLIATLALGIRLIASRGAYPAPGDGGHFVQCGVELANGTPGAMSTYWSQGMIVIAAAASKMGWSPHYAMQYASIVAGTTMAVFATLLAFTFFQKWDRGILAGLLVSVTPAMAHYSVTAYSEMCYVAFMAAGVLMFALSRRASRPRPFMLGAAFVLVGVSVYFKGADGVIVVAILSFYDLVNAAVMRVWKGMAALVAAVVLFCAVIFPLCFFTYQRSGTFGPGTKGLNLALGEYWLDSKAVYAVEKPWQQRTEYLQTHGTLAYLWQYKQVVVRQVVHNAAQSVRLFADQLFVGPFRLGPGWFALLLALGVYGAWRGRRLQYWALPATILMGPLALICLCFVHDRILIPSLFFVMLILADAVGLALEACLSVPGARTFAGILLCALLAKYAQLSASASQREFYCWRYLNIVQVADKLQSHGGESDMLMAHGPALATHFFKQHPFRTVEIPYAEIATVEVQAATQDVTLIAVSDQARPHWPISGVFRGTNVPPNWQLLEELVFPANEDQGIPEEKYRLYRRGNTP